jgi:predicted lysophospholipase L1 biosynthesis ABC-type transport system permease subunit
MKAMFNRLVVETLRTRPHQTAACIASCALACAALQTCVGIHRGIGPNPSLQRLMIGLWASGLLLFVTVIAFSVVALEQYIEVRERTHDYGVLKVLGASTRDFLNLQARESFLIAVSGTAAGIVLTFAAQGIVTLAFLRFLSLSVSFWFLPSSFIASFSVLMLGGVLGARRAVRDGVEEALSYQK